MLSPTICHLNRGDARAVSFLKVFVETYESLNDSRKKSFCTKLYSGAKYTPNGQNVEFLNSGSFRYDRFLKPVCLKTENLLNRKPRLWQKLGIDCNK